LALAFRRVPPEDLVEQRGRQGGTPEKRLASGWTTTRSGGLSNEVILERLAGFGIATSADEFVELAGAEHAAGAVAEGWRQRFHVSARGYDNDLIGIAACVPWERLLPDAAFAIAPRSLTATDAPPAVSFENTCRRPLPVSRVLPCL